MIIRALGYKVLSKEDNLNLLDEGALRGMLEELGVRVFKIKKMRFMGLPSNLLLVVEKGDVR